jgi:hypothetical protein
MKLRKDIINTINTEVIYVSKGDESTKATLNPLANLSHQTIAIYTHYLLVHEFFLFSTVPLKEREKIIQNSPLQKIKIK